MKTLHVDLGERSYPIHIGPGLLGRADLLAPHVGGTQVMIVSNETVAPLYLDAVRAACAGFQVAEVILPDGEQHKTLAVLDAIYTELLRQRFDRRCTLIALGGGVVGDMTGFAAASYQRGVNFIQIPTTLLSQVDSSVGGKTAVNHPIGKNMIGAFYQPIAVEIDTAVLSTLPDREISAGLAEVIKYGAIFDAAFFQWCEENVPALRALEPKAVAYAIARSCELKAWVVSQDERETGLRAVLNFGHTFAHAIEAGLGFGVWLHGEAVGCGMVQAAQLSVASHGLPQADADRVRALVQAIGCPDYGPDLGTERWFDLMLGDKKTEAGELRFILLPELGRAVRAGVDAALVRDTLQRTVAAQAGPETAQIV